MELVKQFDLEIAALREEFNGARGDKVRETILAEKLGIIERLMGAREKDLDKGLA